MSYQSKDPQPVYPAEMFHLDDEEDDFGPRDEIKARTGSEARYHRRKLFFSEDGGALPQLRHGLLWLLHNCVAHPILAISQREPAVEFHELTSQWLNHTMPNSSGSSLIGDKVLSTSKRQLNIILPRIKNRRTWVIHNAVVHPLIGFFPTKLTFRIHDQSASKLGVPGWV